jgi:hypothetical protein
MVYLCWLEKNENGNGLQNSFVTWSLVKDVWTHPFLRIS